jgi:4'-phosphopantetheinyl transferase
VIHWLVLPASACPDDVAQRSPGFLTAAERRVLAQLAFAKRRHDWLLGRWTAKCLLKRSLAAYRERPLAEIAVHNDPDGAPYLTVQGQGRLPLSISISHRDDRAFCALSTQAIVGADIERVETRTPAFVEDFYTHGEAARVWACPPPERDTLVAVMWSAKEAVLKALRHGLRVDTRTVEIGHVEGIESGPVPPLSNAHPAPSGSWRRLHVATTLEYTPPLAAWWAVSGEHVLTLAALPKTSAETEAGL